MSQPVMKNNMTHDNQFSQKLKITSHFDEFIIQNFNEDNTSTQNSNHIYMKIQKGSYQV